MICRRYGVGQPQTGDHGQWTASRLRALNRWAADAVEAGLMVPCQEGLERIAAAKVAEHVGLKPPVVLAWAATLNWLMGQAAFGVAEPHLQLPDNLWVPAGMDLVVEDLDKPAKVPALKEAQTPASSKLPNWESAAREQVLQAITRYTKPLHELKARDANEGDTRLVVTDILCEGLDYDKFRDLTTENMVRQDFCQLWRADR